MHFFDQYPQFYESGITPNANRLRCRYDGIIQANLDILQDARVLDVASHNGRWSAAAVLGGKAAHVVGIEPRADLVEQANLIATNIGIKRQVEFRAATIMEFLETSRPRADSFDVVMCNGYFYHTYDHWQLLKEFRRIGRHLILDSEVSRRPALAIFYEQEPSANIGNAVNETGDGVALVGRPTKKLPTEMLRVAGYRSWQYFNWQDYRYPSTEWMKNYIEGRRVTVRASR